MTGASPAQKVRLGIFLAVAATIIGGTVIGLVGVAALEQRDEYLVDFDGSVSGLSTGSPVKYNGIDIGRVEAIVLKPDSLGVVEVTISLKADTAIPADATAQLNMQGITGLKFIEITGGTKAAGVAKPGATLKSSQSLLDGLSASAQSIAIKIEDLLDNLVVLTGGENQKQFAAILLKIDSVLESVGSIAGNIDVLVLENRQKITDLVTNVDEAVTDVRALVKDTTTTVAAVGLAVDRVSRWVDPHDIKRLIARVEGILEKVASASRSLDSALAAARARLSKDELGATIASVTRLSDRTTKFVDNADVTLIRIRGSILLALDV
ncbi:MAG: phospholipid/cholesterol/gamma-HCH transport system substrate-binding protein, partial [Myxococcota bacterium]